MGPGRIRCTTTAAYMALLTACHSTPVGVEAGELVVRAEVTPTEIAASAVPQVGDVHVVVSVTNPRARAVVVHLGGPPYISGQIPAAETSGIGFGVRVLRVDDATLIGPSSWTWGQPDVTIGPRETARHTFVIQIASQRQSGLSVTPGTYRVIGSFGREEAAPIELRVRP
jgi:hypothetical protein